MYAISRVNKLRFVSAKRKRKLLKLRVPVWWSTQKKRWFWDPEVDGRKCHHVHQYGEHHFEWVDNSFDHSFGTHHDAGYVLCDCGADPNDYNIN